MSLIELAIRMALEAHAGQTDKAGKPYILHALRVLAAVGHEKPEDVQCAAVLHYVLEDGPAYDAPLLAARGFSPRTINLVQMLSRNEGETYDAFIARICQDRTASWIKYCDIQVTVCNHGPFLDNRQELIEAATRLYDRWWFLECKLNANQ